MHDHVFLAYALLFVVIEIYENLKCKDPILDELLKERVMVNGLRALRNSIFHAKRHSKFIEKTYKFIGIPDSENWIHDVSKDFHAFFLSHPIIGKHFEEIKNLLPAIEKDVHDDIRKLFQLTD